MTMNLNVTPPYGPSRPYQVSTEPAGSGSVSFTEWLPKLALKYAFDPKHYVYASAAKGHKAGGYNIQMFADIVRDIIEEKGKKMNQPDAIITQESPESILAATSYQPEHSWNYELGFKGNVINDLLHAELAVFYLDVKDVQITQFVESGQGRLLKNAGRAESIGLDLGLTAYLMKNLSLSANYGYTRAVLKNYKTGETEDAADYSGNFIPFAPQNTFSLSAGYSRSLHNNRIIDRFNLHAQYNGAGKIYWTEANDVHQDFYGLLNLKAGLTKGIFRLDIWTKNTLNSNYAAFYFTTKTSGQTLALAQKGVPFRMGIDLTVSF
jgi:outer membrane receptor protein involved in Fe transport